MDYFIAFDFYGENFSKFFYGVVSADLEETSLPEIAKNIIDERFLGVNSEKVTIKITAFNNIKIGNDDGLRKTKN